MQPSCQYRNYGEPFEVVICRTGLLLGLRSAAESFQIAILIRSWPAELSLTVGVDSLLYYGSTTRSIAANYVDMYNHQFWYPLSAARTTALLATIMWQCKAFHISAPASCSCRYANVYVAALNSDSFPMSLGRTTVNVAHIVASKDLKVQQRLFTGRRIGEISYLKAERDWSTPVWKLQNSGREQTHPLCRFRSVHPSRVTAETDAETAPEQRQQQQQWQWQPQDVDIWAAKEVKEMLGRLDSNGILSQRVAKDIEAALIKFLGRDCPSEAKFQLRQTQVPAVQQLLQCMLDVGFNAAHVRRAVRHSSVLYQTPARIHASLQQLNRLGDMTDRQAVAALGSTPELLTFPPHSLPERLQNVQHITGLTSTQSHIMLRRSVQPLIHSSSKLQASVDGFSGPTPLPACAPPHRAVHFAGDPA